MKIASALASVRILGLTIALALAGEASATTVKLGGTFKGTYAASGNVPGYAGDSGGTTTAKFKSTSGGEAGKLTLTGVDTKNDGTPYKAVLTFKTDGTASTTAIVPGIVDLAGTGTWSVAGKKLKFTFTASTAVGTLTATGTIKVAGKKMTITSIGNAVTVFGPASGKYSFSGTK